MHPYASTSVAVKAVASAAPVRDSTHHEDGRDVVHGDEVEVEPHRCGAAEAREDEHRAPTHGIGEQRPHLVEIGGDQDQRAERRVRPLRPEPKAETARRCQSSSVRSAIEVAIRFGR